MTKFSEKTRFFVLLLGVCGALVLLMLGSSRALRSLDSMRSDERKGRQASPKTYQRTLAEGIRVSRHGCYGIDFIECGSCRIEKMRKGPLTLGGLNVLVIDDLKVVMPPNDGEREPELPKDAGNRSAARDVAERLGVSGGFLTSRSLPLKFSGLRIKTLAVDRLLDYGGKPEKVFVAEAAEASRAGLSLSGCTVFLDRSGGEFVGNAMLSKSGDGLRLAWSGGAIEI